ncbi:MAG: CRTAC1 family protein [Sediminicola sp.]
MDKGRLLGILFLALCGHFQSVGQIQFEDVTKKSGLVEPLKGLMGHGAAWGDATGDGFPDLFVGTFSDRNDSIYNVRGHTTGPEPDKFLVNQGDGTFKEVVGSPIGILGRNSGAAFADFDNDGDLDLVTSHQSFEGTKYQKPNNFLFENDGTGKYTDVTDKSRLDFGWPFTGRNTFVFDYDGDGLLDLLMQEDFLRSDVSAGNSRLMRNMGHLQFKEVTAEAGLPSGYRTGLYGLGGAIGDINGDTWPDIFFAHSCRMFINNGNGTFSEKRYTMVDKGFTDPGTVNPDWTCGVDIGDLDNDGDMDLVMGEHYTGKNTRHRLFVFLNQGNDKDGNPIMEDVTMKSGILKPAWRAPHLQLQDMDNDGFLDLVVSNYKTFLYKNNGSKKGIPQFSTPIPSGAKEGLGYWASGPLVDYDRDGRIDFFGAEWEPGAPSRLLRNVTPNAENYLDIMLDLQSTANRNGIGATVEIYERGLLGRKKGLLGTRPISVSNGYSSGYEAIAHFGLPKNEAVDVRVIMPAGGKVYERKNIKRNQLLVIK